MSTETLGFSPFHTDEEAPATELPVAPDGISHLMQRLTLSLNSAAQPSVLINQLYAADQRCREARTTLHDLANKAPRIVHQIRQALREAFDLEPDTLLFTDPLPPAEPVRIESLTERALASLSQQAYPADSNDSTALSIKAARRTPLEMTPAQAMDRIHSLNLLDRLDVAHDAYWQAPAYGSWLSRKERWAEVYRQLFIDKAFIAHHVQDLSEHGLAMALGIVDAPTPEQRQQAGGFWTDLQVCELVWPGSGNARVPLRGALHIFRTADQGRRRQVVFIPGLRGEFLEFRSLADMQRDLPSVLNNPEQASVWQRLPLSRRDQLLYVSDAERRVPFSVVRGEILTEDALHYSAFSEMETQWHNERACALNINPALIFEQGFTDAARLNSITRLEQLERSRYLALPASRLVGLLNRLLDWDQQRRQEDVHFGQLPVHLPQRMRERLLRRYEQGLLALLDRQDLTIDTEAFKAFIACQKRWRTRVEEVERLLEGGQAQFGDKRFWVARAEGAHSRGEQLLAARGQAIVEEARMQQQLRLIGEPEWQALSDVLGPPPSLNRADSPLRVLSINLGNYPLLGAFVVTTAAALVDRRLRLWAVLWVQDASAGFQGFASMNALVAALEAGFRSRDGSALWTSISRRHRSQAQDLVRSLSAEQALPLAFNELQGAVLKEGLKAQVLDYIQTLTWVDQGGRPFSEISDVALTKTLLANEMARRLSIPDNPVRRSALASVELLRLAAEQAKKLPGWLADVPARVRKRYRMALRHYLSSARAYEHRLATVLPDLETFARQRLIEQLTHDGLYPDIDIDIPAFDVPNDVHTQWESHPVRPIGESGSKVVVSQERTVYSLLQLALHNLDAEAPWTPLVLKHTRYLVPAWKKRLSADYLIKTLSAMDIGGQYEKRVFETFYPAQEGEFARQLMARAHQARAELELLGARQQGLSRRAQRIFKTALTARSRKELELNGMQLRLCVVTLRGATQGRSRHVFDLLVVEDRRSGICVVYWPDAIGLATISEYPNAAQAQHALTKAASSAANLSDLAGKIAPGWEAQALKSYPGNLAKTFEEITPDTLMDRVPGIFADLYSRSWVSIFASALDKLVFQKNDTTAALVLTEIEENIRHQIAADPQNWLRIEPTNGHDALSILAHGDVFRILRHVRTVSNSAQVLREYRELRLGDASEARLRRLLALIPFVSIPVNLYEVLLAARRLYHSGDSRSVLDLVVAVHMTLVDVAMTLIPTGKLAGNASRVGLSRIHTVYRQGPHLTFIREALPLRGLMTPAEGVWVKSVKGVQTYQVQGLASTGNAVALHGPVNRGSYVMHGKQFVRDGNAVYPVYRRRQESTLRVRNALEEGQNEFFLHVQESGEVLLKADAPSASPEPGRPMWRPWERERDSSAQPGPSRLPAGSQTQVTTVAQVTSPPLDTLVRVLEQPELARDLSPSWRVSPLPAPEQIVPASKRVFNLRGGRACQAVKIGEHYYEILPGGSTDVDKVAFVHRGGVLAQRADFDISRWLGQDMSEQPIPVTFDRMGRATLREPLFSEPLEASIERAFPNTTPASRRGIATRLAESAVPEEGPVTTAHLLSIRGTLDKWLPANGLPGQTDALLGMLRPVQRRQGSQSLYIGHEAFNSGFIRLDFKFGVAHAMRLQTEGPIYRTMTMCTALRHALLQQGFVAEQLPHQRGMYNLWLTHPASDHQYFMLVRWSHKPSISFHARPHAWLSEAWMERCFSGYRAAHPELFFRYQQVKAQGRLVKLMGGVSYVKDTDTATLYVVKVLEP